MARPSHDVEETRTRALCTVPPPPRKSDDDDDAADDILAVPGTRTLVTPSNEYASTLYDGACAPSALCDGACAPCAPLFAFRRAGNAKRSRSLANFTVRAVGRESVLSPFAKGENLGWFEV